ncbi:TPA: VENN motif pre-toxin domain-containing protein [Escherichia coli]
MYSMSTASFTGEVNKVANVAAHAVVNVTLAVAQGNNALVGAAGAATGEVVGMIATQMYGKPVSELSETEKQTVSTLATVAAGLAGSVAGVCGDDACLQDALEHTAYFAKEYTKVNVNRPGFPGECFICELRLPDHRFRWKHNKLFLLLPVGYGPAFPAIVDCYTSPPT